MATRNRLPVPLATRQPATRHRSATRNSGRGQRKDDFEQRPSKSPESRSTDRRSRRYLAVTRRRRHMKKIVLTFGLISGGILASMIALMPWCMSGDLDFEKSEIVGYTAMILSFLLV